MLSIEKIISEYLNNLKINSVLDLGCGNGEISFRFAEKNIPVTGIDKKDFQIKMKNFKFIQEDILKFNPLEKFDLIIASAVLHFLDKNDTSEVIKKIQDSTNRKGYNFFVCLSDRDDFFKSNEEKFYPSLDEIKRFYSQDWEIIKSIQDYTDYEKHEGVPSHRHNVVIILFKKK